MKFNIFFLVMTMTGWLMATRATAQGAEAEQLMINYEKLYAMESALDEMYNTYRTLEFGYNTIVNIASGNYSVQQLFIDGLMMVNPSIRNYRRIPYIISYQQLLIQEYQHAYERFQRDPHFTPQEIQYLGNVYSYLFNASIRNIDDLLMIITSTKLSMTDDERLRAVDAIYYDMESKLRFVRSFNSNTQLLAIQRARSANDARTINSLYGLSP